MKMMDKVEHAKELVAEAVIKHPNVAVACSFGKDSMVTVDIARKVSPDIPVFSVMTRYKPRETFEYLVEIDKIMDLNTFVYMVADEIPEILRKNNIKVKLLPTDDFNKAMEQFTERIYLTNPDECCKLLKIDPTRVAVENLAAWITGLRNTEGKIREDYKEVEHKGGIVKYNPILTFTEEEIFGYLKDNNISLHPWYTMEFPDGKKYRSLGCEPCTRPIFPNELERAGRWQGTSKCGGECGIHTKILKETKV